MYKAKEFSTKLNPVKKNRYYGTNELNDEITFVQMLEFSIN